MVLRLGVAVLFMTTALHAADPSRLARAKYLECKSAKSHADAERACVAALPLARQAHDALLEGQILEKLGYAQYLRGATADALTSLNSAYRIAVAHGDTKLRLDALANIANVYADESVGQYDRAIEYYRQLITDYERAGRPSDVADTLFNIGSTFDAKGDFKAAELHFRRALGSFQKLDRAADVAYTRASLGLTLMKQGREAEALPLLDAALAFYERQKDEENIAATRQYRGMVYRRLGRLTEALRDLDIARHYFERHDNPRFLERNAEATALLYAQRGDWRNAYEAQARYDKLQQKLATQRRDELSSRLRVEFDSEKKDQENRALARENALRATALHEAERSRKLQIVVSALIALLAAALAILFWRQWVHARRMRAMAMTDELTRLPNRRHILTAAGIALAAARRESRSAALIVLDIDHFKRINDTYGHAAGDVVLQKIARACRIELRPGDQLGRIGGEEFLVVLHSTTAQQAREIAERLRLAVERLDVTSIAPDLRVTISLGVHLAAEENSSAAIAAADSMLYRAKESGRNRVEMAPAHS